jgi:hypothetical protein
MSMRADRLIDLLKNFPADAIVTGHVNGFCVTNYDGTAEVIVLNQTLTAADPAETSKSQKLRTVA